MIWRDRWRTTVSLAVLALALGAWAGEPAFKGTVEDWYDDLIDEMTFVQQGPWGGLYDVLEVGPLDNSKAAMEGNDKAVAAAKKVQAQQDAICQEALRAGYTAAGPKVFARGEKVPEGSRVVVLEWRCTEISPGSRAKRFWISYGAGQSGIALEGSLKDKATGQELVRFAHRRSSGFNIITGGDYERLLKIDCVDVARDVGAMVGVVLRKPGKAAPARPAQPAAPQAPAAAEPPAAAVPPDAVAPPPVELPPPPPAEPQSPAGG